MHSSQVCCEGPRISACPEPCIVTCQDRVRVSSASSNAETSLQAVSRAPLASLSRQHWSERSSSPMDVVGAVGARREYWEAPTPNEAGEGTCMLQRAIIPPTCMFYCRVYSVYRAKHECAYLTSITAWPCLSCDKRAAVSLRIWCICSIANFDGG